MNERRLIPIVASLALLVVAFVVLGPGRAMPILAARLYGGPLPEGVSQTSFRVVVLEEESGFRAKVAGTRLRAIAEAGEDRAQWEGTSGPDGSAEVRLVWQRPPSGPVRLRLFDEEERLLVEGELPRTVEGWGEGEGWSAAISGNRKGEIVIRAAAMRGVLAAPFAETIVVEAMHGDLPAAHATLKVRAYGASLAGEERSELSLRADDRGRASFELLPFAHHAELVIEAELGVAKGHFSASLPVLPGAMWLEPGDSPTRRIVSPVPRQLAYVAIATPRARLFGATVPLVPDGRGQAEGVLDLTEIMETLRAEPRAMLTLASSETFEGAGTVAWPLWPDENPFTFVARPIRDMPLLDGFPRAKASDAQRRKRAAAWAGGALGGAAVVEGILLYRAARRGRRLREEDGNDAVLVFAGDPRRDGLALALAVVVTLLALATVGVVMLLGAATTS